MLRKTTTALLLIAAASASARNRSVHSGPAAPQPRIAIVTGVIRSITPLAVLCPVDAVDCLRAAWVIAPDDGSADVALQITTQTVIDGEPNAGDRAEVIAERGTSLHALQVTLLPRVVTGTVKSIVPLGILCLAPPAICPSSVWTIVTNGLDVGVQMTNETRVIGDPHVGDSVDVIVDPGAPPRATFIIRR